MKKEIIEQRITQQKKKKRIFLICCIAIAVLLVALGVILGICLGRDPDDANGDDTQNNTSPYSYEGGVELPIDYFD